MNKAAEIEYLSLNEFHKFETPGETLEGVLLGFTWAKPAEGQPFPIYSLFDENVGIVKIAGTVQMDVLRYLAVGTVVKLTYIKEEKSNGRTMRHFNVQVPKSEAKSMVAAMIAQGGVKQIAPPKDEEVAVLDPDADPFADDVKYNQPAE